MGSAAEAGKSAPERGERAGLLEQLREQIRRVQAAPRRYLITLASGAAALDELGVFRLGGAAELSGEEASGRTTLALSLVASACREKRLAAWVDGPKELYPPAAVPLGVDLKRLLIVRPPAPGQLVWSTVQLLRSGAFTLVVLDVTHTGLTLTMVETKKLLDAARAGGALLVVLTSSAAPAQGMVRLVMAERVDVGPRHLRVVEAAPAEPVPTLHVEVAGAHGATGKRLLLERAQFAPLARARRSHTSLHPGLELPRVSGQSSLQRPKRNELRDGKGFAVATRPGRDGPMGELPLHSCAPPGNRRRPAAKLSERESIAAKRWDQIPSRDFR